MLWLGERAEDGRALTMHSIPMKSVDSARRASRPFETDGYLTDYTERGAAPWWEMVRKG